MSRGPWKKTKRLERQLREADVIVKREKELTNMGYEPSSIASAALRNRATDIAEGSEDEWVRIELNVQTAKVK